MVKSKINRFTAMLLSMIMIFSSFSILTTTQVSAASDPERVHVDMYETGIKWAKTVTFYEPLSGKNWTYWQGQERHVLRVRETKQVAYCLQPGTYLYDWGISANPVLSNKLNHAWENLGKEKQNAIKLAMYFGYPHKNTTLSGTANENELATQLIIWEFISGYRDTDNYNRTDARFIKALCGNNYDQNTGIYKAYGQIESALKSFDTVMSFSDPIKNNCPTYTMKWNGKEYSLSLTDTKNVLSKFSVSSSDSKVKLSKSGNTLTVTSVDPISSSIMVTAKKSVNTGNSSTIAYGHESEDIQDVIVKTDSPDPVYGYFKVKTEATGSLRVVKQYKDLNGNNVKTGIESFILNNTKFKIRNSSNKYIKASYSGSGYVYSYTGYVSSASDGTVFTPKNNNGDFYFEVNKLPPGTHEIMEQDNNITGYAPSGSKNIKVAVTANNSGGKKTATFQNKPDQLIINKVFNQFGAVKDDDYAKVVFNLSQINAEGVAATKSFICTDKDNNVYQFINSTSDSAFAGMVTSKELRFVNPKVHSITVTGIKDSNGNGTGEYEMTVLPYGNYFVVETIAPEGYKKSNKTYSFAITENGARVFVDDIKNPPIKGNVSVLKIDSLTKEQLKGAEFTVYNDVDKDGLITDGIDTVYGVMLHDEGYRYYLNDLPYGEYVLKETKAPVGHITTKKIYPFQIIDDGVTVEVADDGEIGIMNEPIQGSIRIVKIDRKKQTPVEGAEFTLYDSNGKAVKVVTTDKDGIADFGQHRYGKYTVVETTAPEKYLADNTPIPFEILEHGKIYGYTHENTPIEGNIEIVKIDGKTHKPLSGAEFTLYDSNENEVQKLTTGADGKAFFAEVPYGKYTVVETKAPKNYKADSTPIPFEILKHGKTLTVTKENEGEEGTATFIKTSEDGVVKDVTLHIYGKSNTGVEVDETVVTGENGSVSLSLLTGTYTVEEIKVADRYVTPAKQTIVIKADKTSTVTFNNILKRGKVTTTKVDEEYPDNKLTGAVFEVYDAYGNSVDTLKEVSKGVYELDGLKTGNYTLKEITAPVGFLLDTNAYDFSIVNDGDVISIETKAGIGFINTPIKGKISVVKVDEKTRKPLSGAEFTIYDTTGKPVKTTTTETGTVITDANGNADFGELRYGTYIVKETKAPENYELDDTPIPFQVLENGKVIEYEKGDPAEEGDLQIIKKSEDGVIENIKIRIYGTSANGTDIDETVLTDKDGKFLIENLLIGTYTVEELEIADRYIKTAPQTVVVSANETASVTFENILKRGKVTTTKIDKDYPDNKLTGAVFEVYDTDGNSVDTLKEVTDMSEKDALTSAFAGKHKDSSAVSSDGTYRGATQGAKNKIDNLQQSQKAQGRSVDSARLSNYSKISDNARKHQNSEQFKNLPEVQAHTAAAAEMHGRSYDPSAPGTVERVDAYQGNMSTVLEHKDEIMSHAQDYIADQKKSGNNKITEEQAIAHLVANEEDYDMSYGFDTSYSTDIAETLIASDKVETSAPAPDTSQQRSERSRSITGNSSVNQNLGREKQSHDKPRPYPLNSSASSKNILKMVK